MPTDFLHRLAQEPKMSIKETAVALLWFHGIENPAVSISSKQLADEMETAGYSKVNPSRFNNDISNDNRTAKATPNSFKIKISARAKLDEKYLPLLEAPPVKRSNSVISLGLIKNTRTYIEKVVLQLNASYDQGHYDCCSVMCRRLLETLIIEVYEFRKQESLIKDTDGHFMMFAGLLKAIESDKSINLSRNALKGLKELKGLGDKSAHNRRFNARKDDIDPIRGDMRTAVEELLHLAGLVQAP